MMQEFNIDALRDAVSDICKNLLNAIDQHDHPLKSCTSEVQEIIKRGGEHGKRGEYEQAINCFSQAAEIDTKYIGSQLRLIKAYKNTGHDAKALFTGGIAIKMSTDSTIRCQLYDMMGQIAKGLFERDPTIQHLDDAIGFYHEAMYENQEDLGPRWNLFCAYLDGAQCLSIDEVTRRDWEQKARNTCSDVISFVDCNRGETLEYIGQLVSYARANFPSGDWWVAKLRTLEETADRLKWVEKKVERKQVNTNFYFLLRKALLVSIFAVMMIGLPADQAAGVGFTPLPTIQSELLKSDQGSVQKQIPDSVFENQLPVHVFEINDQENSKSLDLVEIERDWEKLAEIERDWFKLA